MAGPEARGDGEDGAARLVLALDVEDRASAERLAASVHGHADVMKVGLGLYLREGDAVVRSLVEQGWPVFLDLKFHDIPATVGAAVAAAAELGVEMLTVHASGGARMLETAVEARGAASRPLILGVTLLTSLGEDDLTRMSWPVKPLAAVRVLAQLARDAGCDGVVASPREVAQLRRQLGPDVTLVVPGIRPAGTAAGDQARTATPAAAVRAGADYLVVGRPIRRADDPAAAAARIRGEMEAAGGGGGAAE